MAAHKTRSAKPGVTRSTDKTHPGTEDLYRQFPSRSHEEIMEAIRKAGPDPSSVLKYLSASSAR